MAVKIRLTRVGRHKDPSYRIVAADSRYTRDGRIIEQIGTYDPSDVNNAAKINEEVAIKWLNNGAQPSDTVKALLSKSGVYAKFLANKKKGE
ncbi:MAG: 30S ribosomal protein S16 [Bacilli bacterium]|nr:30S ribosomal protein S16 [Bacilli bacterium]